MRLRNFQPARVFPAALAAGSIALILLQSRLPAGPRHAGFAILRPFAGLAPADEEYERLRRENSELLASLIRAQRAEGELKEHLRQATAYREAGLGGLERALPASVVLREDPSGWHSTIVINRGSGAGVKAGMLVVEGQALVGRVLESSDAMARVRLVADAAFKLKAVAVPPGGKASDGTAATGILAGNGDGLCRLECVLDREPVAAGWTVVTVEDPERGQPGGLGVGDVVSGGKGSGVYGSIVVKPRCEPRTLRFVMVMMPKS
jgi:cell shape-determining protein MreC